MIVCFNYHNYHSILADPNGYFRYTNSVIIWSTLLIILPAVLWNYLDDSEKIFNVSEEEELIKNCVQFVNARNWCSVKNVVMFHCLELAVIVVLIGIWQLFELQTGQSLYEVAQAASVMPIGREEHPMFPIDINCSLKTPAINPGSMDNTPTMCHLPINLINQASFKIFVCWCVFILVPGWLVTFCYRLLTICCPYLRNASLVQGVAVSKDCKNKLKKLLEVKPSYCSYLKLKNVSTMVTYAQTEIIIQRLYEAAF